MKTLLQIRSGLFSGRDSSQLADRFVADGAKATRTAR